MAARPLVGASLALAGGIGLGAWLPQRPPWLVAAAAALLALWLALLALRRDRAGAAVGVAAVLAVGGAWSQVDLAAVYAPAAPLPEGDAVVAGKVARVPERRGEATALLLEEARIAIAGRSLAPRLPVEIVVAEGAGGLRLGDRLTARGRAAAPRGDRNLGWFPHPAFTRARRLATRVYVASPLWVRRDGHEAGSGPGAAVLRWREAASAFWGAAPSPAGPILAAFTTGERAAIPAATQEAFLRSGLTHLLAISGMNVAFLAALVYLLLRRLLALAEPLALRRPVHPFAAAGTLPFIWFFYRFSGSQIPVGRAAVAMAAAMVAIVVRRRIDVADGCALAAIVVLAADPRALFSPSFQLSFAAVGALALAAPRLPRPSAVREGPAARLRRGAWSLLLVSLAAGSATAPLVAFHFQQVNLVGPLANLVAVPLAGFLVLTTAWAALLAAAGSATAGGLLRLPAVWSADALVAVAEFFAAPSWASVRTPRPPPLLVIALLALVAAVLAPGGAPSVRRLRAGAGAAAAAAVLAWWLGTATSRLRAVFLDVGQGLAAVALGGGAGSLLVDAGPRWRDDDAGRRIVAPALRRLGLRRLDALAVTHDHPDHAGGVPSLLDEFPVGEVWTAGGEAPRRPADLAAALRAFALRGGSIVPLGRGTVRSLPGGLSARALGPPGGGTGPGDLADENARSLVLLVSWEGGALLVTGDAGPRELAAAAPEAGEGPAVVLQVPHHGASAEACALLAAAVRPGISVVPVGRNAYGHPRAAALEALAGCGVVRRTDRDGAVFVFASPAGLRARSWRELAAGRTWAERLRWAAVGW